MKLFNAIELNDEQLETMYLDYLNNFIGLKGYADHYGISYELAESIIDKGRELNYNKLRKYTFDIRGVVERYSVSVVGCNYRDAMNRLKLLGYFIPDSIVHDYKVDIL